MEIVSKHKIFVFQRMTMMMMMKMMTKKMMKKPKTIKKGEDEGNKHCSLT